MNPERCRWTFCHLPSFLCHTRVSSVCLELATPFLSRKRKVDNIFPANYKYESTNHCDDDISIKGKNSSRFFKQGLQA